MFFSNMCDRWQAREVFCQASKQNHIIYCGSFPKRLIGNLTWQHFTQLPTCNSASWDEPGINTVRDPCWVSPNLIHLVQIPFSISYISGTWLSLLCSPSARTSSLPKWTHEAEWDPLVSIIYSERQHLPGVSSWGLSHHLILDPFNWRGWGLSLGLSTCLEPNQEDRKGRNNSLQCSGCQKTWLQNLVLFIPVIMLHLTTNKRLSRQLRSRCLPWPSSTES